MTQRSEGWGPPQSQEKRSRSEKAILGALGEFRGILGAALGIRNSILEMASHDLSNTKTTIFGATPGAIPGIDGNPHLGIRKGGGAKRIVRFWGGKTYHKAPPPKPVLEASESGICMVCARFL